LVLPRRRKAVQLFGLAAGHNLRLNCSRNV
jgi:hypothetical protein